MNVQATRSGVVTLLLAAAFLVTAPVFRPLLAQNQQERPPLTWVCPMPQDEVYEDGPGLCPICGMELIPTRIDVAYTCPDHPAIMQGEPGVCPLDKRELVRVNVALHWECSGTRQPFTEPGTCEDGSGRKLVRDMRAHGDHNPRHGGSFFMAEDRWHHLEGTYPSANLFRLFLYDNFTRPISSEGMSGHVFVLDQSNKVVGSFPMTRSSDGTTLEARLRNASLPLKAAALVKFDARTPEQRFDFTFNEYSANPP